MTTLFSQTKELVMKIDNYIDLTEQAALHFREGLKYYINDKHEEFGQRIGMVRETEKQADTLRKDIVAQLYVQTLIPESRGDVLGILESMDSIPDSVKITIIEFSIENPVIPAEIKDDFFDLTESVLNSVSSLADAAHFYFYDANSVKSHLNRVKFYEREADEISERIKRKLFSNENLRLSQKLHLKQFVTFIDDIADEAENVSDRIGIAAIKRII